MALLHAQAKGASLGNDAAGGHHEGDDPIDHDEILFLKAINSLAGEWQQGIVEALDNNALKFAPTTDDALRILFGPRTTSYLDARRTLESSFGDLKKHQALVFSAMQTALQQLIEELDPERIEAAVPPANGVAGLLKSRPGELWNHYQVSWKAKAGRSEHKMLDAFMRLFSEAYDAASR